MFFSLITSNNKRQLKGDCVAQNENSFFWDGKEKYEKDCKGHFYCHIIFVEGKTA